MILNWMDTLIEKGFSDEEIDVIKNYIFPIGSDHYPLDLTYKDNDFGALDGLEFYNLNFRNAYYNFSPPHKSLHLRLRHRQIPKVYRLAEFGYNILGEVPFNKSFIPKSYPSYLGVVHVLAANRSSKGFTCVNRWKILAHVNKKP